MDVFDLFAKISIDSSGYEQGLKSAGEAASSFGDKLKSGLANAAKIGAAALAAVTAATTAMSAAMIKGVSDTAAYGDNIDKMSQKMGMSAQAYQEWDAIMQHSGTSIESLQSSMKTLANAVENENDAFGRLGITQKQIASMNNEELFSATITALQNVESETERTYLAGQLLGRGATELGALLNTSAEDTEAMRQRVHELGGVMSDEAVKAAAAYQDSLQDMQTAISGVSRGLTSKFMPSFTKVMNGITEIFSGDSEKGIGMVSQGLDDVLSSIEEAIPQMLERGQSLLDGLVNGISEHLPRIASVGMDILGRLGTAITENLPQLTESAAQIITMLATGMISALPEIASSAVQIITTLASWLAEQLPTLVPVAIDAILTLFETLTDPDNLGNMLDAAIEIILALGNGLIDSLPKLAERVPKIVQNIVDTIIENAPKLLDAAVELIAKLGQYLVGEAEKLASKIAGIVTSIKDWFIEGVDKLKEAGKQLLEGLWSGINDKVEWLKSKVKGVVDTIKGWFTGSEGFDEHSPSKWSQGVGEFVMQGLSIGLESGKGGVMATVEGIIKEVKSRFDEVANFYTAKSDVGNLEYQLWERTEGRGASDLTKYAKKLELLSVQQEDQTSIVEAAEAAYKAVVEQYGAASTESYKYQKTLLQEKLALQDLLDEINQVRAAKGQAFVEWARSGANTPFQTSTIDFQNSALGLTSAATINAISGGGGSGSPIIQLTANLMTPDGKVMAEYLADPLTQHMEANGTPIVNPRS